MSIYGDLIKQARADEDSKAITRAKEGSKANEVNRAASVSKHEEPLQDQAEAPVHRIELHPDQPRKYFDPAKMHDLATSIRQNGVIEPLIVRPLPSGAYELVAGERRLRASKEVGLSTVPIKVYELTEAQARKISLVENLQREELNPVEEVEAILKLIALELSFNLEEEFTTSTVASLLYRMQNEAKGKVTHNVMGSRRGELIEGIFESLSIAWKSFVTNKLPVLRWPDGVLQQARAGKIAFENAKVIARIKDDKARTDLLSKAISESLSVAAIREHIANKVADVSKHEELDKNSSEDTARILKTKVSKTFQKLTKKKTWEKVTSDEAKSARIHVLIEEIESLMA